MVVDSSDDALPGADALPIGDEEIAARLQVLSDSDRIEGNQAIVRYMAP